MMPADPEARVRAAVEELASALLAVAAATKAAADAPERLLSVDEAAASLGIGRSRLYLELGSSRLGSLHVGRRVLIPASAIAAYIARQGVQSDGKGRP
jgi:excisionase family DNA binding protein